MHHVDATVGWTFRVTRLNPTVFSAVDAFMASPKDIEDNGQRPNMWEELNRPRASHRDAQHRDAVRSADSDPTGAPFVDVSGGASSVADRIDPQHLLLAGAALFAGVTVFAVFGLGGSGEVPTVPFEPVAVTTPEALAVVVVDDPIIDNGATATTVDVPTAAEVAEPMAMGLPASLLDSEQSQVFRLYRTALGRAPDRSGFDFWSDQVRAGVPLEQLANEFLASEEFQAQFTDDMVWDNRAERLLTNAFGPADSSVELDNWLSRFAGLSGADLLIAISEADETLAVTGTLR